MFALLATGLVAQAGRRTVVGMLAGVGVAAAQIAATASWRKVTVTRYGRADT